MLILTYVLKLLCSLHNAFLAWIKIPQGVQLVAQRGRLMEETGSEALGTDQPDGPECMGAIRVPEVGWCCTHTFVLSLFNLYLVMNGWLKYASRQCGWGKLAM